MGIKPERTYTHRDGFIVKSIFECIGDGEDALRRFEQQALPDKIPFVEKREIEVRVRQLSDRWAAALEAKVKGLDEAVRQDTDAREREVARNRVLERAQLQIFAGQPEL